MKINIAHHTEQVKQIFATAIKEGQKRMTYLDNDYSFREWTAETIIDQVNKQITKDFKIGNIHWLIEVGSFHEFAKLEVRKIKGPSTYFTSDNPLTTEDKVTQNAHPLDHSVEFTIALNPKYLLRIYHDNQHDLNFIWRTPCLNVDTAVGNQTIFYQAERFLVGNNQSFQEYFEMEKAIFQDNSVTGIMRFARPVIDHIEKENRHDEYSLLLKKYLEIFERNGGLSPEEEQEFFRLDRASNLAWRKSRLT